MLEIKNLHAEIDNQKILQGVTLQVKPRETHVILGPNGSGKSTFGRVILGDPKYKQTQGEITLNNKKNANTMSPSERSQNGFFSKLPIALRTRRSYRQKLPIRRQKKYHP